MSDGRDFVSSDEGMVTQAEAAKKGNGPVKAVDEVIDLEGMELGAEGDLDHELGIFGGDGEEEGDNEGDDEHVVIKDADTSKMEARYQVEGQPDYFNFRTAPLAKVEDNHTVHTENDWYLRKYRSIPMFAQSIKHLERVHLPFEIRSAYDKKTHQYAPFAEAHRPMHAMTEGGKGLAMYTRATIYMTADMSTINNVNITFGCPSNCSFCKESILARGYTQLQVDEKTGTIRVETESRPPFEVPSKSKVKFYDPNVGKVVYGPLSVAVVNEFPISSDSLDKLRSGDLVRLLSD